MSFYIEKYRYGGTEIGRSVTVVEDGGKRTVLGLDEKGEGSGWSYGGNMVLTLDGFTGEQIRLNGGSPDGKDLFNDENRIIFTGSGYGYYAVRNEAGPGQPEGDSR